MTPSPKRLFIATLLAATGAMAVAQGPAPTAAPGQPAAGEQRAAPGERRAMDPAERQQRMAERQKRMAERHAQRLADLKSQLKVTPAQEAAWTTYTAAMQPPANAQRPGPRMAPGEFAKLTTPQRIDRMQAFAAERQAQMKQRGDAIKAFYAQLTPEQQKLYDERAMRGDRDGKRGGKRDGRRGHGHGGWGGPGMGPGPGPR